MNKEIKVVYKSINNPEPVATIDDLLSIFQTHASLSEFGSSAQIYYQERMLDIQTMTDNDLVIAFCHTGEGLYIDDKLGIEPIFRQSGYSYPTTGTRNAYWYNNYFLVHETDMKDKKNRVIYIDKATQLPFVFKIIPGDVTRFTEYNIEEPE